MAQDGPITLTDLVAVLRDCAGEDDGVDLGGDIADRAFTDLGYDSVAMMEVSARMVERFGLRLDEARLFELGTPAEMLRCLNQAAAGDGEVRS
ncbi:act minimal PKS acyl carrier protein [Actinomadura coerulea]|uniref:Act minimal PKS acyl carrier protein n=1 Tax=Actinomadura coerulea TaxID=46159 RepID=A0A7X0FUX8_9ACTN|nr:acyl carrier protein [Actinomadura coerulea]MBB6394164.1 act minimal PKS acyl carrier protein [Actinomadura coerulea]GGQ20608.1 actinorhodin polyketide synthase acyl carrier protein [Actinomadura coerulea]